MPDTRLQTGIRRAVWAVAALSLGACATGGQTGPTTTPASAARSDAEAPLPPRQWRHRHRSGRIASIGAPRHVALDRIVSPQAAAELRGKLTYGSLRKDLEHEDVSGYAQVEGRWVLAGTAVTDGHGWVSIPVEGDILRSTGPHPYRLVVHGDGSVAEATLYVLAPGTRIAVFDVDGTLTEDDFELVEQLVLGRPADAHPGAAEVVRYRAEAGDVPVYITGRPYMLDAMTRRWLREQGFPDGALFLTRSLAEARPRQNGVQRYKTDLLRSLQDDLGLVIDAAYGNAHTDVCAYAEAGLAPESTFIIGRQGGTACAGHAAPRAIDDFRAHLAELRATSPEDPPAAEDGGSAGNGPP